MYVDSCVFCPDSVYVHCAFFGLHGDRQQLNIIFKMRRAFVAVCATLGILLDLCSKEIKSRRMRWVGYVARMTG